MPRLAICSRDLHWQWINWAPLYATMEVSMLRLTWLTVAQHVFQPALTGRLELISRKIVSCEPGTKAIAVSRFREKLSPANWVQGVTAISRKISRSWAPKNGVQHATAIYPIPRYTRPRYIGLTLYICMRVCVRLEMCVYVQTHTCACVRVSIYKWVLFCLVFVVRLASQLGCVVQCSVAHIVKMASVVFLTWWLLIQ